MPSSLSPSWRTYIDRKNGLLVFIYIPVVFFIAGLSAGHYSAYRDVSSANSGASSSWSPTTGYQHPVTRLMYDAEENFRSKLSQQSKTLSKAVSEYKRRYRRNPPKGFDQWFQFAQENDFLLVDEFDAIEEDLAPFRELSGLEIRRRTRQVALLPNIDLVQIRDGNVSALSLTGSNTGGRASGFLEMIERYQDRLPDMEFSINAVAEGRVLVPWENREYPNTTLQDSSRGLESMLGGPFETAWNGDGNVWDAFRRTCPPNSAARRIFSSLRNVFVQQVHDYLSGPGFTAAGTDFQFVRSTDANFLFCDQPWAHFSQSAFFSDYRTISALFPVFSPAKGPGFMDIRVPSHYYFGSTPRYTYGWDAINLELKMVDPSEVPWEDKIDKVFWRGASTGGGSSPAGFQSHYQRHRFVRMASITDNEARRTVTYVDPSGLTKKYQSTSVPMASLNADILDVAFVSAVDPYHYEGGLQGMRQEHRFGDPIFLGEFWKYKYIIDLDGNAYSGRFMAYMNSDSAVLKSTVYREYFQDWIEPWLHFIPVSSSYKEIYNIHHYFSGPSSSTLTAANTTSSPGAQKAIYLETDRRLRRIARAGKQWKNTVGKQTSMEVYVYRLCLEWARLWADDRDSMDFEF